MHCWLFYLTDPLFFPSNPLWLFLEYIVDVIKCFFKLKFNTFNFIKTKYPESQVVQSVATSCALSLILHIDFFLMFQPLIHKIFFSNYHNEIMPTDLPTSSFHLLVSCHFISSYWNFLSHQFHIGGARSRPFPFNALHSSFSPIKVFFNSFPPSLIFDPSNPFFDPLSTDWEYD